MNMVGTVVDAGLGEQEVGPDRLAGGALGGRGGLGRVRLGRAREPAGVRDQGHHRPPQQGAHGQVGDHRQGRQPVGDIGHAEADLDGHQPGGVAGQPGHGRVGPLGAPGHHPGDHDQGPDDHGQGAVGELDAGHARPQVGPERLQGIGQPGLVAGHGRADQHLEVQQAGRGRGQADEAAVLDGPAGRVAGAVAGPEADPDEQGDQGQGGGQVQGDRVGPQLPPDHERPDQRLGQDQDQGGHGRPADHLVLAGPPGRHHQQRHQHHHHRGDQPVGVLDPGVELGRGDEPAEAARPVGAAEAGVGRPDQPAHGDQHEGGGDGGDRQTPEPGRQGLLRSAMLGA
jgi:hypothetical protein